jgi:hypothetical protein
MWRALWDISVIGEDRPQLIGRLGKEAEIASMWLWRKRDEQSSAALLTSFQ